MESVEHALLSVSQRVWKIAGAANRDGHGELAVAVAAARPAHTPGLRGGRLGEPLDRARLDRRLPEVVVSEPDIAACEVRSRDLLPGEVSEHQEGEQAGSGDDRARGCVVDVAALSSAAQSNELR